VDRVVVVLAKVVVQPFAPQEQVIPKLPFKSRPCDPTEVVAEGRGGYKGAGGRELGGSQSEMSPADAGGAVEEQVGKYHVAKPPARAG